MHDIYDGYFFALDDSLCGAALAAGLTNEIKVDTSDLVEFFLSAKETHFEIKMREICRSVHMVCVNI